MSNKNVNRNSRHRTNTRCPRTDDLFGGVGGRQTLPRSRTRGGGYPNICTVLNFDPSGEKKKRDPRFDELQQMGLQRVWLDVAAEIGVDALLKLWRILDADQGSIGDDGRLLVPLRSYSTFLRFQRNRYIETLNALGKSPREIRDLLKSQLCEMISIRHISRLIQKD